MSLLSPFLGLNKDKGKSRSKDSRSKVVDYWPYKQMLGNYSGLQLRVTLVHMLMSKKQNPRETLESILAVRKSSQWSITTCGHKTLTARPLTYKGREPEIHRTGDCYSRWPDWTSLEQLILLKTVKRESKFKGKMTVFARLTLQWPETNESLSLWNIWETEGLPSNSEQQNWSSEE